MSSTLTCAQCATEFPQPAVRRGGRVQRFCTPKCRVAGANSRRSTTRIGRTNGPTNPQAGEPSGRPSSPTLPNTPESVDMAASDARASRINALTALADSRGGIDPWQVAELAKLKGISPWAPLRVILGQSIS